MPFTKKTTGRKKGDVKCNNPKNAKAIPACFYVQERDTIERIFLNLTEKLNQVEKLVNPTLELKNGKTHIKTQTETVQDSWERLNVVQNQVSEINERTKFLKEFEDLWQSGKDTKKRSEKYLKPFLKFVFRLALFVIAVHVLWYSGAEILAGKLSLGEFFRFVAQVVF